MHDHAVHEVRRKSEMQSNRQIRESLKEQRTNEEYAYEEQTIAFVGDSDIM